MQVYIPKQFVFIKLTKSRSYNCGESPAWAQKIVPSTTAAKRNKRFRKNRQNGAQNAPTTVK